MKEYLEKLLRDEVKPTEVTEIRFMYVGKVSGLNEENILVKGE